MRPERRERQILVWIECLLMELAVALDELDALTVSTTAAMLEHRDIDG